jgi:hypothetical protein
MDGFTMRVPIPQSFSRIESVALCGFQFVYEQIVNCHGRSNRVGQISMINVHFEPINGVFRAGLGVGK